jgi:hypothetical protein
VVLSMVPLAPATSGLEHDQPLPPRRLAEGTVESREGDVAGPDRRAQGECRRELHGVEPPCMFSPDQRGRVSVPLWQPDRTVQSEAPWGVRARI